MSPESTDSTASIGEVCHRGVAHPWLCDGNNHLNTRYYIAALDDAAQHYFALLGHRKNNLTGWADVSQHIQYRLEIPVGALFTVECAITKVGRSSLAYRQWVRLVDDGAVAAEVDAVTVYFDLEERRSMALPHHIAERAAEAIHVTGVKS